MNRQSSNNNRIARWRWLLRWKNALNHDYKNFHIYARPCIIPYLLFFFNLLFHFVKFSESFTSEVIKNKIFSTLKSVHITLIFLFIITATATNTTTCKSSMIDLTITPPPKDGSKLKGSFTLCSHTVTNRHRYMYILMQGWNRLGNGQGKN